MATPTATQPQPQQQPARRQAPPVVRRRTALIVPGMIGPKAHPDALGFRPGEHHVVVNDRQQEATAFTHDGRRVWKVPALARGQNGDGEWRRRASDTPPGLYLTGKVYRDWQENPRPVQSGERLAYGWVSLDLIDLEGQETNNARAGIMVHGGGSALGWPGAWAPLQELLPTLGCVRMHNQDLQQRVLPLLDTGRLFWSVYQEA